MDNGMFTGAIYIDLSKAFDTISHASIIEKLPDFGITGIPQQWLEVTCLTVTNKYISTVKNLLKNLCSAVFHKNQSLDRCFLYYILTIQLLYWRNVALHADWTVIFYSHKNIKENEKLSSEFIPLSAWLKENELILNCKKGKNECMIFGNQSTTEEPGKSSISNTTPA